MSTKILKNIDYLITMDFEDKILRNVDVLIEDNVVKEIGENLGDKGADTVIDCTDKVVMPGFVNTHHHLYQTMFRGIDEVQEMPLFPWLTGLYEFWKHLNVDTVYYGAMIGFSELLRTGCTTTCDHHYLFPKGESKGLIDAQFRASSEIGIRFTATRGSMSLSKKDGGLPPESVVQSNDEILEDSIRLIEKYHDVSDFSMKQVALAPCSPFSVTKDLMIKTADLSERYNVMLHTHLAETIDEENFCLKSHKVRPLELMEEVGWLNERTWFAHGIYFNDDELIKIKDNNCGIAHCPSSNMKLGSGICRTSEIFDMGIKLGIAVDGSASNDGSNMWEEIRRTYLLNHLKYADKGLSAYKVLQLATVGGAKVLGRNDIGRIMPNMAADLIAFDLKDIAFAGCHNPLTSIVGLGNHSYTDFTMVNGEIVAKKGEILKANTKNILHEGHKHASEIVAFERKCKN
ncbi:MAG: 8-oxoguanine deaminase [Lachnospirales bacterium]